MKNKVLLFRFSDDGFLSKYQNYHAEGLEIGLKKFKENPEKYPIHLLSSIGKSYSDVIPEWKEFATGVFVFAGSLPDEDNIRILLNHLDKHQKEKYSWWSAEIDDTQYCFDVNNSNLWRTNGFCQIRDMIARNNQEIFIPQQFLKLENIQQWGNNYKSIFALNSKEKKIKP